MPPKASAPQPPAHHPFGSETPPAQPRKARGRAVAPEPQGGFRFLPPELTLRCRRLIESYHEGHGYSGLADILWHQQTRAFIAAHAPLQRAFRKASITRSAKKASEGYLLIATVILALEILASGFAGWGERFPVARRRADELLNAHLPNARTHLTDTYLYHRWGYSSATSLDGVAPP